MATIRKVKKELRHREWAEEIAECQSSGMKIRNWCRMKGISCNTDYFALWKASIRQKEGIGTQRGKQ